MTDFLARLGSRELFPDLEARAYLNHAAMSPLSVAVRDAMVRFVDDHARKGLGALFTWFEQRRRLREKLASFIGADASEVAFVPSTTEGIVDIALCFPWRKGDRVVVLEGEFPTNVTPWQQAARRHQLELVMLSAAEFREDEARALETLEKELERGVRLVAVSAVQFQTGFRMPLEELVTTCHRDGCELFVDAIQALGVVPTDVKAMGIDYLVCGSHKWMMAIEGIAFVYAPAERAEALRPEVAGWLSHERPVSFLLEGAGHLRYDRPIRKGIDFLEGGSLSSIGCGALEASVDLLMQLGPQAIFDHVNGYLDALEPRLTALGFESLRAKEEVRRSGILSLLPPSGVDVIALQKALGDRGVACNVPDGFLRFSPHWSNALDEIDYVVESVEACVVAAEQVQRS